jgi:hypothetical protein
LFAQRSAYEFLEGQSMPAAIRARVGAGAHVPAGAAAFAAAD